MFSPDTLQRPPVQTHLPPIQCESVLSTLPTRKNVHFLCCEPKMQQRPCEAVPHRLVLLVRPRTTNHMGVPEFKVCESTMKQVCDGSTGGDNLGKNTRYVVTEVKSSLRHVSQRRRPVEFW